jgi:hypothetical protein
MKYTNWALKFTNYDNGKTHTKHKLHDTRAEAYSARKEFLRIYAQYLDFDDVKIKVIKVNAGPFECDDDAEKVEV